ncbi:MAG: TIGR02679 domain-containing protein [Acetatifactor sp.]
MSNNTECAAFLRENQGYHRCMTELRRKWRSYGKIAGRIHLKDTVEEERMAIGGILGKRFFDQDISFSFVEFEQGLQKTRYAPVDMKELLEAYFGEKLVSNQEKKEDREQKKNSFYQNVFGYYQKKAGPNSAVLLWMREMITSKKFGYQLLTREYQKDTIQAEKLAKNVGDALIQLEQTQEGSVELPLSVFAAKISDNPHYFDRGTAPGQLLMCGICFLGKREFPENAHQWRERLMEAGIVPDNISSFVHAYGLRLQSRGGWHPAYDAFCSFGEPYVITMENLRGLCGAAAEGNRVYVVENEMVFSYLLEHAGKKRQPEISGSERPQGGSLTLLCTSGQLRAVALELFPLIFSSGADIYYSGDIDPDGIGIADRLWQRFGDRIHLWRMSPEDYERSISKEPIGGNGVAKLETVKHPLLQKTAECVKASGRAAYQENLLEELLQDIQGGNESCV